MDTYDVVFPAGSYTVTMDCVAAGHATCEVDSINLGDNATFRVVPSNVYLPDSATLAGIVDCAGGDFSALDATLQGNRARVACSASGLAFTPAPSYSSAGLWTAVGSGQETRLHDVFVASDAGTQILLGSLTSLDAGFDDNNFDVNVQQVRASSGAVIDLSDVTTITAPVGGNNGNWSRSLNPAVGGEDRIDFPVSGGSTIDLSSLQTIATAFAGQTRFEVSGSTLPLPALSSANWAVFDVQNAASVTADAVSDYDDSRVFVSGGSTFAGSGAPGTFSSLNLWTNQGSGQETRPHPMLTASGTGSVLDLGSLTSLDAGFDDNNFDVVIQQVQATSGGAIDLSDVTTITAPVGSEDRIEFTVADSGQVNLGSLHTISTTGAGEAWFTASNEGSIALGDVLAEARLRITASAGAVLIVSGLSGGQNGTPSSLELSNSDVTLDIAGTLDLGPDIDLNIVEPGTRITVGADFSFAQQAESSVQLDASFLHMDGTGPQHLEVGGSAIGSARPLLPNFGIGQLIVGQSGQPTTVRLRNDRDNGNGGAGINPATGSSREALYLLGLNPATATDPRGLRVLDGSTLSLECVPTYAFSDNADASGDRLNDLFPAGVTRIAYDGGFLLLGEDLDGDDVPDCMDTCPQVSNPDQADSDGDGIGNVCDITVPLDDPSVGDQVLGLGPGSQTGTSVAAAGDLDGDGIRDFLVGAPGYNPGSLAEAGSTAVYLGSAILAERVSPDILFVGIAARDRTGVAVAGDFDFNGDGFLDILIGAEQTNRSGPTPVATGPGKVYLIFFDPTDAITYPNLADPNVPDTIDLSRVANGQADDVPGIVFVGAALGDRAGFSVAAGGRVNAGTGQDILIGAPGSDPGAKAEAGAAYVIFDDASLSGTVALADVASGLPGEIDGVAYRGDLVGGQLGHAVAFPGDVVGTAGDDLALGAPFADLLAVDAGVTFVAEGGTLGREIVEGCSIGDDAQPNPKKGTQIRGTQAGEALGSSIAGGGDSLVDGEADLLVGAPSYDRGPAPADQDAGRVIQTASKLPYGLFVAEAIGAPVSQAGSVPGAIWLGATGGDRLGTAVAGLGDVTRDGLDDAALGAPGADPNGVSEAGIVYLVAGRVSVSLRLGLIDLAKGFGGTQFIGTEAGEMAGSALVGPGDVNDDSFGDFLVGAPGHDGVTLGDNAGLVYVVLECGTSDVDSDSLPDCRDNCRFLFNPGQEDADGDGIGDVCDFCPDDLDPAAPDTDFDGVPEACDNCAGVSNPSQSDSDVDGVGDACDTNPVFVVGPSGDHGIDFSSVLEAVNSAAESGTLIRIRPLAGGACYLGTVYVERSTKVFYFVGDGAGVCIDGDSGPAFNVKETFSTTPIGISNLTLKGAAGIVARVPVRVSDVAFEDISDVALDLVAGSHSVTRVTADSTVSRGVNLACGASLQLSYAAFEGLGSTAMNIAGAATVETALIAHTGDGLVLDSCGSLVLRHATVTGSAARGVDNSSAGLVTIAHSIFWDNATGDLAGVACANLSWSLACNPDCSAVNDNVCGDPLFVDPASDYRLQTGSIALEHGPDPATFTGAPCTDLAGAPRLVDFDGNGLAHMDIGAFETENGALAPSEVANLRWTDAETLVWDALPGAVEYHVYRDGLAGLGYDNFGICVDALDPVRTDAVFDESDSPASGAGWFYVVTVEDGGEGSMGRGTCAERTNFAPCP